MSFAIARLLPVFRSAPPIQYLLRDFFASDVAAGNVNGTTADPGPGTRATSGDGSVLSITGGQEVYNGTPASTLVKSYGAFERVAGRLLRQDVITVTTASGGRIRGGWDSNNTNVVVDSGVAFASTSSFYVIRRTAIQYTFNYTTPFRLLSILRPKGTYLLYRSYTPGDDDISGSYNLLLPGLYENAASMYAKWGLETGGASACKIDNWEALDLGGAYSGTYALASEWQNLVSSGDVIADNIDGYTEVLWTPSAADVLEIRVRRTDDDNCLLLRCDQAAGTIKLFTRIAGAETEYSTGKTATFNVGTQYLILIRHVGDAILSIVDEVAKNTATLSYNNSVAGAKVTFSGAVADLAAHPWTVTL